MTIGQLFNDVNSRCLECDHGEILDALYNLSSEHAILQRFLPNNLPVNFEKVRNHRDWGNFFTVGQFRLKTLPGGRKRFEWLAEQLKLEQSKADSSHPTINYDDLTEAQLQDLAVNNRIPSKMKMTPSGEIPVWDKQHVIEWLKNRDQTAGGFGNSKMADDQIKAGQDVIENMIGRLCSERNVRLTDGVNWHYDFNHMKYWLECAIEGQVRRWSFSREKVEDVGNDPTVQREIYRQLGQFVVLMKSDLGEQLPTLAESKIDTPTSGAKKCDVLVCHATEDKDYVEPLAEALRQAGISTWYDRFSLQWGDDLRRKIDEGLKDCAFGIVVFSPAFLKVKKWTEYELSGLFAKEKEGAPPVILPILHNITIEDLAAYAPSLSTRLAKNSSTDSIEDIIRALKSMLGRSGLT